jgi:amino acid permease
VEIRGSIETGEMALIVAGKKAEVFVTVMLTLYMLGVVISKCIMTSKLYCYLGNTLSTVFEGIQVLDSIYLWLAVFFFCGSVFSFGNIQQTKVLQYVIIAIRFFSLFAMIGGAIYIIAAYGSQGLVPAGSSAVNFSYFPELFSNSIFGLLCHHTIPSIVAPVRPP